MQTGQRSLDPKPSWKHRLPGLQTYVSFYGKGRVTGIKIPISGPRAADSLYLEAGLDSNQERVSHSPWASITEYHRPGTLNNRTAFLIVCRLGVQDPGVGGVSSSRGLAPWLACGHLFIQLCFLP